MRIALRQFNKDDDTGFIYDTYPKGVWWDRRLEVKKRDFMRSMFEKMIDHMESSDIRIACLEEDPDLIVGYSIISKDGTLHFVYVKRDFRRLGVGGLLTRGKYQRINEETITNIGRKIYGERKEKGIDAGISDSDLDSSQVR